MFEPPSTGGALAPNSLTDSMQHSPLSSASAAGSVPGGPETRGEFEVIFRMMRQPMLVLDDQRRIVTANREFYRVFQLRPGQVVGELLYEVSEGAWGSPEMRQRLEEMLLRPPSTSCEPIRLECDFPGLGLREFLLKVRRLGRKPGRILVILDDVTSP